MAMITPDLLYDFPHPVYIIFYLGHSLTVLSVLFAMFVFGFQPQLRSVGIAIVATIIYGLIILAVNLLLGTNYLFLMAKPSAASLFDYLGPWPWYLVGLTVLCVIVFVLCYLPFPVLRKIKSRNK